MKHGYVAYAHGTCRCDAICKPDHKRYRRAWRAALRADGWTFRKGTPVKKLPDGRVIRRDGSPYIPGQRRRTSLI